MIFNASVLVSNGYKTVLRKSYFSESVGLKKTKQKKSRPRFSALLRIKYDLKHDIKHDIKHIKHVKHDKKHDCYVYKTPGKNGKPYSIANSNLALVIQSN